MEIQKNKIYNEDCIEFMRKLPDESVNLIIADPPYNIGKDKGDGWDNVTNYLEKFEEWCVEWKRILDKKGLIYCYCSQWYQADIEMIFKKYFIIQNRIIYHYNNGQRTAIKRFPYSYEPIFLCSKQQENNFIPVRNPNNVQKGVRTKRNKNGTITVTKPHPGGVKYTDVWDIPKLSGGQKQTTHPTEKPLELSERMLRSVENLNLVYIPFAGSGSEIVSCIKNKRNWLATEVNNTYIKELIDPRIQAFLSEEV